MAIAKMAAAMIHQLRTRGSAQLRRRAFLVMARGGWGGGGGKFSASSSVTIQFSHAYPLLRRPHPDPLPEGEGDLWKVLVFDARIKDGFGNGGGVVAAGAAVFEHDGEGDFGVFAGGKTDEPGVMGTGVFAV